jgi:hypothetical protein
MLCSQGKWHFMLLVGCLGTALCWNGRLLTLGRNFLTLFSFSLQLSITITLNILPHCTASIRKAFSSEWEQTSTFSHYRTELLGVFASQFWRWTSLWNGLTYFPAVLSWVLKTHEECHNMLLNINAFNSGAGTAARECVLRYPGGLHTDDDNRR